MAAESCPVRPGFSRENVSVQPSLAARAPGQDWNSFSTCDGGKLGTWKEKTVSLIKFSFLVESILLLQLHPHVSYIVSGDAHYIDVLLKDLKALHNAACNVF